MINAEYDFHNENDCSDVGENSNLYKMRNQMRMWRIYRELTRFYNRLTYRYDGEQLDWELDKDRI